MPHKFIYIHMHIYIYILRTPLLKTKIIEITYLLLAFINCLLIYIRLGKGVYLDMLYMLNESTMHRQRGKHN